MGAGPALGRWRAAFSGSGKPRFLFLRTFVLLGGGVRGGAKGGERHGEPVGASGVFIKMKARIQSVAPLNLPVVRTETASTLPT